VAAGVVVGASTTVCGAVGEGGAPASLDFMVVVGPAAA